MTLASAGVDDEPCAQLGIATPSTEFYLRDGGNRCQRLATETHGVQREQVLRFMDFRRAVTFESQTGIGVGHTHAVVNYLDERTPSIFENDLHTRSLGIDGILHQFLDYRGGTLNHLAGGNLVGY